LDIVVGLAPLRCLAGFALECCSIARSLGMHRAGFCHASARRRVLGRARVALRVSDPIVIPAFAVIVFATWPDRGIVASMLQRRVARRYFLFVYLCTFR
jgi:hypothetical protein